MKAIMIAYSGAAIGVEVPWPGPDILVTATGNTEFDGRVWQKQNYYGMLIYAESHMSARQIHIQTTEGIQCH